MSADTDAHARLREKMVLAAETQRKSWFRFGEGDGPRGLRCFIANGKEQHWFATFDHAHRWIDERSIDAILRCIAASEDARELVIDAALTEGRTQADIVAVGKAINKYLPPNIAVGDLGALAVADETSLFGPLPTFPPSLPADELRLLRDLPDWPTVQDVDDADMAPLRRLQRRGLVRVTRYREPDGTIYVVSAGKTLATALCDATEVANG